MKTSAKETTVTSTDIMEASAAVATDSPASGEGSSSLPEVVHANGTYNSTYSSYLMDIKHRGEMLSLPPIQNPGQPIAVKLNIDIFHMLGLRAAQMDFTMDVILRQIWTDSRLSFAASVLDVPSLGIPDVYYEHVWLPDTFFYDGKEEDIHDVTMSNKMFRVYHNDTIVYSQRMKLVVWCALSLYLFPMDKQTCDVKLGSYRYSMNEVMLYWNGQSAAAVNIDNLREEEMAMFTLSSVRTGHCHVQAITGNFTCINFTVEFERKFGYYVIQVYVPSVLIVLLSWLSFWLEPGAVPARTSLGLLTILAMTNQLSALSSDSMPKVSYIKAIDVWLSGCMSFLVAAMLEYAVVSTLVQRFERHKQRRLCANGGEQACGKDKSSPNRQQHRYALCCCVGVCEIKAEGDLPPCCASKADKLPYIIDRISRFVFPTLFLIFNITYWTYYLHLHQLDGVGK